MAAFWEPEEFVGQLWHRLVGDAASYPHHADAVVTLEEVRGRVGVLFRALGGPGAVRVAGAAAQASGHRLGLKR
ncbi:MAG TPA: protein norD, partial [Azospirillum sp.]